MNDPRLDRLVEFDDRSRGYPVRALLTTSQVLQPRSYTWRVGNWFDQGREGACVGFAWTHEAAARPVRVPGLTDNDALTLYRRAQKLDEWPGEDYDGTSVLAGAKASQELRRVVEYRWAFGIDDLILAVGYKGPAVLGVPWYQGMYAPDENGYVRPTGRVVGGHAILCHAVSVRNETAWLWNSWGRDWGDDGRAKITLGDLSTLLKQDGEACVPVRRAP